MVVVKASLAVLGHNTYLLEKVIWPLTTHAMCPYPYFFLIVHIHIEIVILFKRPFKGLTPNFITNMFRIYVISTGLMSRSLSFQPVKATTSVFTLFFFHW